MSGEDRLPDFIAQMEGAARDALSFIEGLSLADFEADLRTQRAVIMSLMILGEAASRIAEEYPGFAASKTTIPWPAIRGMRNRIAHGYFSLDLRVVWQTLQTELPPLIAELGRP